MPRSLNFRFADQTFACILHKVDRKNLYGSVDVETLDVDGEVCTLASLANDGKTVIPYGGTASGYMNADGEWLLRKDLTAVDDEGQPIELVESSFDTVLNLERTVSVEDFLNFSIRLCFRLECDVELEDDLAKKLVAGDIFKVPFSYRGGVSPDPAFVLQSEDGVLWLLVATVNDVDFVALEEAAVCRAVADMDDEEDEDADALDLRRPSLMNRSLRSLLVE